MTTPGLRVPAILGHRDEVPRGTGRDGTKSGLAVPPGCLRALHFIQFDPELHFAVAVISDCEGLADRVDGKNRRAPIRRPTRARKVLAEPWQRPHLCKCCGHVRASALCLRPVRPNREARSVHRQASPQCAQIGGLPRQAEPRNPVSSPSESAVSADKGMVAVTQPHSRRHALSKATNVPHLVLLARQRR
jgi:hypothetical protein